MRATMTFNNHAGEKMSTKGETLYHPINGSTEETWNGFSWPGFLFGVIWLAVKQLWVHFIVSIIIMLITAGFGAIPIWFFYGFAGNSIHKKSLLSKGYLTLAQYEATKVNTSKSAEAFSNHASIQTGSINVADELAKLAQLRDSGVLSESEFTEQKSKLLSR